MPYISNLSVEDVKCTWANFGHFVDHRSMGDILRQWKECLPGGCIRLRVCLAQAAGSGLVSLDVFARALNEHRRFPWPHVMRLYPGQWDAAVLALRTVAANPHYGFKTNLEHVNSSNYSSDAWLCGRLLIRAGDETLSGYKGFRPDTPRTKVVEDMITQHLSEGVDNVDLSSPFTPAETGGLLALIDVAAIHCA